MQKHSFNTIIKACGLLRYDRYIKWPLTAMSIPKRYITGDGNVSDVLKKRLQEIETKKLENQRIGEKKVRETPSSWIYNPRSHTEQFKQKRFAYNPNKNAIVDRLQNASQILRIDHKEDPFENKGNSKQIAKVIGSFPLTLIVKTRNVASINIKSLVDYLERINSEYNRTKLDVDIKHLDPNEYQILLEYSILKDPDLLKRYLNEDKPKPTVDMRFFDGLNRSEEVILIHMSDLGFKKSSTFLHQFENEFQKHFQPLACILNAPRFPVLTQIRKPDSKLTEDENNIMEDNLYEIASLGLVHVTKMSNETIVLTRKSKPTSKHVAFSFD